jgi:hypothetical protein
MAKLRRVAHGFPTQRVVDSRHEDANLLRLSAPLPYGVGIGIEIDVAETHADVDTDSDPDPDHGRDLELGCGRQPALSEKTIVPTRQGGTTAGSTTPGVPVGAELSSKAPGHGNAQAPEVSASRGCTALVMGICALLLAPVLTFRMGVDQGVFAYMGAALLAGRWPYLGTWESDFPGLMFIQAAQIFVLGKSIAAFRLFDVAVQLANAYLVYRIARRVAGGIGAAVAAITFVLIYQGYGPWNTGQREGFGMLFVLLGYWLYYTAARRRAMITAAAIGLGFGLAVLIKPTLLALATFYAPLLLRLRRDSVTLALAAIAAMLAPLAAVAATYWLLGGLQAFYEACFAYQEIYTQILATPDPLWRQWLVKLGRLGGTAAGLSLAYVPFLLWGPARRERAMLYLGYLGSVGAVLVQGTFAGYHYLPGLGVGAVLLGSMFSQTSSLVLGDRQWRLGGRQISLRLLAAAAILTAALPAYLRAHNYRDLLTLHFLGPPRPEELHIGTIFDFTESWELAEYLRTHTEPGDRIQVWGYESLVYYLAQREAASRFQTSHGLVMRVPEQDLTPMQRRWREEHMHAVQQQPPRYVAVVRDDNWWWAPGERTSEQLLSDFPEWQHFIDEHYELETTIGRFLVYRRSAPP